MAPRYGRWLQDGLAAIKLFILFFIICCGFAALGGKLRIEKPDNFTNAFVGTTNNGYNIGTAILNVIFSFGGYDNVNAVSREGLLALADADPAAGPLRGPQPAENSEDSPASGHGRHLHSLSPCQHCLCECCGCSLLAD